MDENRTDNTNYEPNFIMTDPDESGAAAAGGAAGTDAALNLSLIHIYFEDENKQLAELVNEYESLSIASKNIVAERLDVLLERESVFYGETSTYSDASAQ